MRQVYLHLGYHKTATTFLQKLVFPRLEGVNYIPLPRIKKDLRQIRLRTLSDMEIENFYYYFKSFNNGKPLLISYEGLSGSPFSPKKRKRPECVLADLRKIFPPHDADVSVIIGIREQVALLTSLYVQQLHQGGTSGAKAFIRRLEKTGSIENFHFHRYLRTIEQLFGEERLHVMVYEHFKERRQEELEKLVRFLGETHVPKFKMEERNKSYGTAQVAVARRLNRFFKTKGNPKGPIPVITLPKIGKISPRRLLQNKYSFALHYKRYEFPEELQNRLRERYQEGNRELAKMLKRKGIDLPAVYLN